jgi:hypothetical protein
MKRILIVLILCNIRLFLSGQTGHPDLGLHGQVTWLSDTKIRVEYDWSSDSQLTDWSATKRSTLVRGDRNITISGGMASVRSMIWKQPIKCSRIYAQDAKAINSPAAHLNFITNVFGWTGYNFNPPEIIGVIYISYGNIWVENEASATLPGPGIVLGNKYTVDINISDAAVTAQSSSDNVTYSYSLANPPDKDRQVAIGGWGGDTEWGKLTIEGEITPFQTPSDMINIQSCGSAFAPVIEVTGGPIIEWIFDDGTTSASATPVKEYGSPGSRHNLLRVTPWSALIGINTGYDASDGGYGGFAMVANQSVLGFQNLTLAKSSLQYLCASYSPLTELDISELSALRFVESLYCLNLANLKLGNHPALERLGAEGCNLASLDLSGCAALEDLRAASNNFSSINWGSTGAKLWHICIRSNPQLTENLPVITQFPLLRELLTWDDNQTGAFVCHSSVIQRIDSYDNHYTSADISGCTRLSDLSLSGSQLASLDLSQAGNLINIELKNCGLRASQIDYVLKTLDEAGRSNGYLELDDNAPPSSEGLLHYNNLIARGWTIFITDPSQKIPITGITVAGEDGATTINTDNGTLQVSAIVTPVFATDTTVTWSITDGTDLAVINNTGLITALDNGTVIIRATANDGSGIYGELPITILNQSGGTDFDDPFGKIIVNNNELRILLTDNFISWEAGLYNLLGVQISRKFIESDVLIFNNMQLSPGIYIVVLLKGGRMRVAKVLKP